MNTSPAVCVFAGSSNGTVPDYVACAASVGRAVASANRLLVYGGGFQGVMGAASKSALAAGGNVVGVIPRPMAQAGGEKAPVGTTEAVKGTTGGTPADKLKNFDLQTHKMMVNYFVDTMHERKARMAKLADGGFIVLPGGFGTFEEALEVATWNQLGIHAKPIVVANVQGYFDSLRQQFKDGVAAGFIHPNNISLVKFINGPEDKAAHRDFDWGKACMDALVEWKNPNILNLGYVWPKDGLDAI